MISVFPFAGFPVAVFGLGRSGRAAARALMLGDAEVWAWDDNEDVRAAAREAGIPLVDLYSCNWQELTSLVLSPGIPHTHPQPHPVVTLARDARCEVISDVELLARTQRDAGYIGITGTNGKSTTTALVGHILQLSGRQAEVGGNLGVPALELEPMEVDETYVLEMSSFQLELTLSITFDVAVLLNISADHLERHGGMDGYIAAKKLIFHRQTSPRTAVIGVDDKYTLAIYQDLKAAGQQAVIPVSGSQAIAGGVYVVDGILYDDSDGGAVPVLDLKEVPVLPGVHNWQNAAAAYATAKAGVVGLTNSLAREFGDDNIRVNAIAPGGVVTERQLELWYTEEQATEMANRQFIKTRLLPDEIARTVLFLAADDSRMITKQCITVDAGLR